MGVLESIGHKIARKEKEKITPVHSTGMNVSPLPKCKTRRGRVVA